MFRSNVCRTLTPPLSPVIGLRVGSSPKTLAQQGIMRNARRQDATTSHTPRRASVLIKRLRVITFLVVLVLATLAPAQRFTDLHNFTGGTDGAKPWAGAAVDGKGNIYSTTIFGGSAGYGTVFEVDSSGEETVLHSFVGTDGAEPWAGVILDAANNIYGTTMYGGCCKYGTVFKVDSSG